LTKILEYDIRHQARLGSGGNRTGNEKKEIYSEVVQMNPARILFFSGELYGFPVVNDFLYGKTKEKFYITVSPEFG
jgi:hypothetical protein